LWSTTGISPPTRWRVATTIDYLPPARHRLNLTIRPHAHVHRVLFEGVRAVGVEVDSGGKTQAAYGKRVTPSTGAIASPSILLRSGIGLQAGLVALGIEPLVDLSGVCTNLLDHPAV
jgi:choline dehydrogenase